MPPVLLIFVRYAVYVSVLSDSTKRPAGRQSRRMFASMVRQATFESAKSSLGLAYIGPLLSVAGLLALEIPASDFGVSKKQTWRHHQPTRSGILTSPLILNKAVPCQICQRIDSIA